MAIINFISSESCVLQSFTMSVSFAILFVTICENGKWYRLIPIGQLKLNAQVDKMPWSKWKLSRRIQQRSSRILFKAFVYTRKKRSMHQNECHDSRKKKVFCSVIVVQTHVVIHRRREKSFPIFKFIRQIIFGFPKARVCMCWTCQLRNCKQKWKQKCCCFAQIEIMTKVWPKFDFTSKPNANAI